MQPKAFISYSWTSPEHQEQIRQWADRLMREDGVEILFDLYDLQEGQDKYAYMERMVTDPTVTHVLVFSDRKYSEKADTRHGGVGTESQIISREVYEKVDQAKFIPIICEKDEEGTVLLPTFFKSRIYFDFSSLEAVNENWERLVRRLYDKPLLQKPTLGKTPAYILANDDAPISPATGKYATFKQAYLEGRRGLDSYRSDFLDTCVSYADSIRIRDVPQMDKLGERVLADCTKLVPVRNHLVDWVLLEANPSAKPLFWDKLLPVLERILELKSKPIDVSQWGDNWPQAHATFVYETFLYIVASLLKKECFQDLHCIFSTNYFVGNTGQITGNQIRPFSAFYGTASSLHQVLTHPSGQKYITVTGELVKRQSNRSDIPFTALMEAELLIMLQAVLHENGRWHPHVLYYAGLWPKFPFFLRAMQRRGFEKLAVISGIADADALRQKAKVGLGYNSQGIWQTFAFEADVDIWEAMNMDKLDSVP